MSIDAVSRSRSKSFWRLFIVDVSVAVGMSLAIASGVFGVVRLTQFSPALSAIALCATTCLIVLAFLLTGLDTIIGGSYEKLEKLELSAGDEHKAGMSFALIVDKYLITVVAIISVVLIVAAASDVVRYMNMTNAVYNGGVTAYEYKLSSEYDLQMLDDGSYYKIVKDTFDDDVEVNVIENGVAQFKSYSMDSIGVRQSDEVDEPKLLVYDVVYDFAHPDEVDKMIESQQPIGFVKPVDRDYLYSFLERNLYEFDDTKRYEINLPVDDEQVNAD